jgi:CRP-like cAMP-binding protein
MVRNLADRKVYADFLAAVPGFENWSRNSLEEFLTEHASEVTCPAGATLHQGGVHEARLIVLLDGSAVMSYDDEVSCALVAGDYFGAPNRADHPSQVSTVTAIGDVRALVIGHAAIKAAGANALGHRRYGDDRRGALSTAALRVARRTRQRDTLVSAGGGLQRVS